MLLLMSWGFRFARFTEKLFKLFTGQAARLSITGRILAPAVSGACELKAEELLCRT